MLYIKEVMKEHQGTRTKNPRFYRNIKSLLELKNKSFNSQTSIDYFLDTLAEALENIKYINPKDSSIISDIFSNICIYFSEYYESLNDKQTSTQVFKRRLGLIKKYERALEFYHKKRSYPLK